MENAKRLKEKNLEWTKVWGRKNKDTHRHVESKNKKNERNNEGWRRGLNMYCNQIDHLRYWLERNWSREKVYYVSRLSPFKRGIGADCKNGSKYGCACEKWGGGGAMEYRWRNDPVWGDDADDEESFLVVDEVVIRLIGTVPLVDEDEPLALELGVCWCISKRDLFSSSESMEMPARSGEWWFRSCSCACPESGSTIMGISQWSKSSSLVSIWSPSSSSLHGPPPTEFGPTTLLSSSV